MASILKPVYAFYSRHYQARPILTICTTNAVLAGISDTLTQKYLAPTSSSLKPKEALAQDIEQTLWHESGSSKEATSPQNTSDLVQSKVDQSKDRVSQIASEGKETAKETLNQQKTKATEAVEGTKEIVEDNARKTVQSAKDGSERIKEFGEQTVKEVKDRAISGAKDAVGNGPTVESAKRQLKDKASEAKGRAHQMVSDGKDKVRETVDDKKSQVSKRVEQAKVKVKDAVDETKGQVSQKTHEMKEHAQNTALSAKDMAANRSDIPASTPLDMPRLGRFMLYNFSVAPLIHTWYSVLDKNVPAIAAGAATATEASSTAAKNLSPPSSKLVKILTPGLKRMVADQALFAPVGLALLFSGLTVMEGGGTKEIKDKLNNAYLDTLKANYMVWPLVQLVNFSVMPLQLRLPFVSAVGIAWNAYLSFQNTRAQQVEKTERSHSAISSA